MLTRELYSQIVKPVAIIVFLPGDVSSVSGSPIVPAELERHTVMVSALRFTFSRQLTNFSPNHQVHPPRASLQTYENALAAIYKKGFPDLFSGKAAVIDLMGDSGSSEDETDRGTAESLMVRTE